MTSCLENRRFLVLNDPNEQVEISYGDGTTEIISSTTIENIIRNVKIINSINISPPKASVFINNSIQLSITSLFSDGTSDDITDSAIFSLSNENMGNIINGRFEAFQDTGEVIITVSLWGKTTDFSITILDPNEITHITIKPDSAVTILGSETIQFNSFSHTRAGETIDVSSSVSWNISGNGFITQEGIFYGNRNGGISTIYAIFGAFESNHVTVNNIAASVTSFEISTDTISLYIGQNLQFSARLYYDDGSSIIKTISSDWLSTSEEVATVNTSGRLTALSDGFTIITANYNGKISNSITIQVLKIPEHLKYNVVNSFSFNEPVIKGTNISSNGYVYPGNILRVFLDIEDNNFIINTVRIFYENEDFIHDINLYKDAVSGLYQGNIIINDFFPDGEYVLSSVRITGLRTLSTNFTEEDFVDLNLDISDYSPTNSFHHAKFYVTNTLTFIKPEINNTNLSQVNVSPDDIIRVSFDITENDIKLEDIRVRYRNTNVVSSRTVRIFKNPENGYYEGNIYITDTFRHGEYVLNSIQISNSDGFNKTYYLEDMPNLSSSDKTKFTVNNPDYNTDEYDAENEDDSINNNDSTENSENIIINSSNLSASEVSSGQIIRAFFDIEKNNAKINMLNAHYTNGNYNQRISLRKNTVSNLYEGSIYIDDDIPQGEWRLNRISISTDNGSFYYRNIFEISPLSLDEYDDNDFVKTTEITVSNSDYIGDYVSPEITSITIEPNIISAGDLYRVLVEFSDTNIINSVNVYFRSPSGQATSNTNMPVCEYNPLTGKFEGIGQIPLYGEDGNWEIFRIFVNNKIISNRTYLLTEINNLSLNRTITVSNSETIPDIVVTSVSVEPSEISANDYYKVSISVEDTSVIENIRFRFRSSTDASFFSTSNLPHCVYNPLTGKFEGIGQIPLYSADGYWLLDSLTVNDIFNNSKTYNASSISENNLSCTITVNNSLAQQNPPEITEISLYPPEVSAGDIYTVSISVSDKNLVDNIRFVFNSPNDLVNSISQTGNSVYNPLTGKFVGTGIIPVIGEDGIWKLNSLRITNKDGATKNYNADEIHNINP